MNKSFTAVRDEEFVSSDRGLILLEELNPRGVRDIPLKGLRLAVLRRTGLPVPPGLLVTPTYFRNTDSFAESLARVVGRVKGTYIVRSLDDDDYLSAGALKSYPDLIDLDAVVHALEQIRIDYDRFVKGNQRGDYGDNADAHRLLNDRRAYWLKLSLEEALREDTSVKPVGPIALIQPYIRGSRSGSIATGDRFYRVELSTGPQGPSDTANLRELTMDNLRKSSTNGDNSPDVDKLWDLVRLAEQVKARLNDVEFKDCDWLIEWVENERGFQIVQARPLISSQLIRTSADVPFVFAWGREGGVPILGKVQRVTKTTKSIDSSATILLVDTDVVLTSLPQSKSIKAILFMTGSAYEHHVLRARAFGVFVGRCPEAFDDAKLLEGKVLLEINGDKLTVTKQSEVVVRGQGHQEHERLLLRRIGAANTRVERWDNDRVSLFRHQLLDCSRDYPQGFHPDRAGDTINDAYYCVNSPTMRLVLPRDFREFVKFIPNSDLPALILTPFRFTFSFYDDLIMACQVPMNGHLYMEDQYRDFTTRGGRPFESKIRAFNHEFDTYEGVQGSDIEYQQAGSWPIINVHDSYWGGGGGCYVNDVDLLVRILEMLKKAKLPFSQLKFRFSRGTFECANKMSLEIFSAMDVFRVLGYAPIQFNEGSTSLRRVVVPTSLIDAALMNRFVNSSSKAEHQVLLLALQRGYKPTEIDLPRLGKVKLFCTDGGEQAIKAVTKADELLASIVDVHGYKPILPIYTRLIGHYQERR